jgi:outer membrane murein-binding lipoprotein Lpp
MKINRALDKQKIDKNAGDISNLNNEIDKINNDINDIKDDVSQLQKDLPKKTDDSKTTDE